MMGILSGATPLIVDVRQTAPTPSGVQATYAFGASNPTHFVDVSDSMDAAVESLGAHQAYLDGLGGSFDADEFLRGNASQAGAEVGCKYAVTLRAY
jgi:LmbE family N-acetylglucosaminyl deacetylase